VSREEEALRRALTGAVPPMREAPELMRAVEARMRRGRARAWAMSMVVAAGIGVALMATAPTFLTESGRGQPGTGVATSSGPEDATVRTAGCATRTSPPAMSIGGTPQPANQGALSAVAQRLRVHADRHFTDVFTELELRPESDRIRVSRKPSAAFDEWVRRDFAEDCVEVVDARFSARELRAMVGRVEVELPYWLRQGIRVTSLSIAVDGTITLDVPGDQLERARTEIPRRYPDLVFAIERGGPVVWQSGS